jgi:hypothetical protein
MPPEDSPSARRPNSARTGTRFTDRQLVSLTWQYAAMVGIVSPLIDPSTHDAVLAARQQWAHLIETGENGPIFNLELCAQWMNAISSEPLPRCRAIIVQVWADDEF